MTKPFFNSHRSKEKKIFKKFISNKKFTHDFFSINCFNWQHLLKEKRIKNYLEIGAFEGLSICFVNKNFRPKIIHAVDTWKGSNEHGHETKFNIVKKNYKFNTRSLRNLKNFKMTSDIFFKNNLGIKYDLIYIDGLHTKSQVNKDLVNSLKVSKKNTIIICDDFFWKFEDNFTTNLPIGAIIPFVKKNKLRILGLSNNQIFLKVS